MVKQRYLRTLKRNMNGWVLLSLIGVAIVLLPNLYIFLNLFKPTNENWIHIKTYMLADYTLQSFWLVSFTGLFTVMIGVSLAWLVTAYEFPFRKFFRWALILPLAIPPYIAAYTYSSMLSYTGVVQKTLRNELGWQLDQRYFDIMSLEGAIFIFTMFLFPYVYIITRTFVERQSAAYIENARLLGKNSFQIFFQVVLPISRAAIIGGVSLVIFEVLNDYGVTSYFGISTFTTAIFQTWFAMYDIDSAMRLAVLLMIAIIGLFIIERLLRNRKRFSSSTSKVTPLVPKKLNGLKSIIATVYCSVIFALSFLIPFLQLVAWAKYTYRDAFNMNLLELVYNTLFVSGVATIIIVVIAVIVANVSRVYRSNATQLMGRLIASGYSVPGTIIAIGVLALFLTVSSKLSLTIVMLITGYVIRFLAIGYNSVDAGYEKVGKKYYEASRMLGNGITKTFFKVDLRMIRGAILSGFILTFIEVTKELPLTLLLRPFNFETLATKTYQYANDEQIIEAAIPSLIIIGVSILSVILFHRFGEEKRES